MADRAEIETFLASSGWAGAARAPLAGDASSRSYDRLSRGTARAVLMKAPPGTEIARFVRIGAWLAEAGYSSPAILARDDDKGLLLLEDFGDALMARRLETHPEDEAGLYAAITEFLADLHRHTPPADLSRLDGEGLAALLDLVPEHYPRADRGAAREVAQRIADTFEALSQEPFVMCLRDFHAENIILLERPGHARLGLLDFQDAVQAHPAYDLVSALQDARRDVSPEVEARELARYAALCGIDADRFSAIYALIGVQRALRIMGIFAKLARVDRKPRYLGFMPRVWGYVERNLAHPELAGLARCVEAAYPAPTPDLIEELRHDADRT
ncbi:aminoglycoside phosphotransferase family protein [Thioclava atlantica]|uniref:Aminoglycoside phosphotransferase n=1 Tax=Thioclava atlantica TaxID=1317124 RepID=A0A085TWX9_9RHOB|nr:phosphotransferase [Thioclava atlantica]KFE35226.1 aminoglycoside phosphotransferase [Thioclava atlantica]